VCGARTPATSTCTSYLHSHTRKAGAGACRCASDGGCRPAARATPVGDLLAPAARLGTGFNRLRAAAGTCSTSNKDTGPHLKDRGSRAGRTGAQWQVQSARLRP
jgi:hypothetical protein